MSIIRQLTRNHKSVPMVPGGANADPQTLLQGAEITLSGVRASVLKDQADAALLDLVKANIQIAAVLNLLTSNGSSSQKPMLDAVFKITQFPGLYADILRFILRQGSITSDEVAPRLRSSTSDQADPKLEISMANKILRHFRKCLLLNSGWEFPDPAISRLIWTPTNLLYDLQAKEILDFLPRTAGAVAEVQAACEASEFYSFPLPQARSLWWLSNHPVAATLLRHLIDAWERQQGSEAISTIKLRACLGEEVSSSLVYDNTVYLEVHGFVSSIKREAPTAKWSRYGPKTFSAKFLTPTDFAFEPIVLDILPPTCSGYSGQGILLPP